MKRYITYGILIGCLFISLFFCFYRTPIVSDTPTAFMEKFNNWKLMDSLHNRVLYHGDTLAYRHLRMIHYLAEHQEGFLFYALVASNKYNYKTASYDVHVILTNSDSTSDVKTREMANYYLEKSKNE